MKILGIDIGGSAIKAAPVDTATGRMLAERHRLEISAKMTPGEVAGVAAEVVKHFGWKGPVGVGYPGVVHGPRILTASNLHEKFIGCDGEKLFAHATGCPVSLTNDAAAAALAEMRFGAGKGFAGKTLLLTLGTGVGSALAFHGVVVPCEFGHLPWKGRSAEKRVAASVRERKDLSWEEWGGRLDAYLGILERALWPELIVIGGGVSAKYEKFFPFLHTRARVVPAKLYNGAGIVGAALWAEQVGAQKKRKA